MKLWAPWGMAMATAVVGAACFAGCQQDTLDPGGDPPDEAEQDDDPLAIEDEVAPGSFDDLYRRVIVSSCSGQAGACHNGQFEPNLSTPELAWVNLVQRPSLEKPDRYRVDPTDPSGSLLIDKLRNRGVITVMPLGANHLEEADIAAFEKWIAGGARRTPDSDAPKHFDNPPEEPVLSVFDAGGQRLDATGSAAVEPGMEISLRMTTHDFETADEDMAYAFFILQTIEGDVVVLNPEDTSAENYVGYAAFDAAGPALGTEAFNWEYRWTVPEEVTMYRYTGEVENVSSRGLSFLLVGGYGDTGPGGGAMALSFTVDALRVTQ